MKLNDVGGSTFSRFASCHPLAWLQHDPNTLTQTYKHIHTQWDRVGILLETIKYGATKPKKLLNHLMMNHEVLRAPTVGFFLSFFFFGGFTTSFPSSPKAWWMAVAPATLAAFTDGRAPAWREPSSPVKAFSMARPPKSYCLTSLPSGM